MEDQRDILSVIQGVFSEIHDLKTDVNSLRNDVNQNVNELRNDVHKIDVKVEKSIAEGEAEHTHIREVLDEFKNDMKPQVEGSSHEVGEIKTSIKTIKGVGTFILSVALILGAIGAIGAFFMMLK